jgi:hypothetical protein
MSDASDSLKKVSASLDSCVERCRAVSGDHSFLKTIHDNMRSLHAQIPDEGLRNRLNAEMSSAAQAHKNVADGHDQLTRGLEAAQLAVRGAADAAGGGDYVEPTHDLEHQGGAQVSDGRVTGALPGDSPRSFTPEAIRERDQRRGIEAGYLAKIKAMRGH